MDTTFDTSPTRPPRPGRGRAPLRGLTCGTTWSLAGFAAVVLAVTVGSLWAAWLLLDALLHLLAAGASHGADLTHWVATGPVTRVVTTPVRAYLDSHANGLPANPGQLWWTWLASGAVLLLLSWLGSHGARLGWVLLGALTAAMTWAGSSAHTRPVAAGVAVTCWALLSVAAFRRRGDRVTVLVDGRRPDSTPSASTAPAPPAAAGGTDPAT
ncbi:MAG TPA: hypothetical protein VJT31_28095 [Rugosimonospora sp.]|nr:hypothetical protein [Rugosimonospora sp.]